MSLGPKCSVGMDGINQAHTKFLFLKAVFFHNPRLIPAPSSLPPHNTPYGEERRVRVERGGRFGRSVNRTERPPLHHHPTPPVPLSPPCGQGWGLCMGDSTHARARRAKALERPPAATFGLWRSQTLDNALQTLAFGFSRRERAWSGTVRARPAWPHRLCCRGAEGQNPVLCPI